MIALRHLAAPANWCRQITGGRTGAPSPQACRRPYPQAAVAILIQRCHHGAETSVIAITGGAFAGESRRGFPLGPRDCPPTRFRRDPPQAREQCGGQAPDMQSVDRSSSNSPARRACQSRRFRRVPIGAVPTEVLGSCCPGRRGNGTARTPSKRTTPDCVPSQR
jgi:hypothetical protein